MLNHLRGTVAKNSTMMSYNFMIYKTMNLFASQSFESLLSQISSSTSALGVLQLYKQHKELFRNEHVILSLRTIGRLSKTLTYEQVQAQETKELYDDLAHRIDEIINDINEFDLLDVLFWIRRSKQFRASSNVQTETYNQLFRRIGEFVEQKVYSFRNLVNVYYDMSMVGKYNEVVPDQLLKALKADPAQLTQFASVQLLQAASKKSVSLNFKELLLVDTVLKLIQPMIEDFDYDQKTTLFKYIAELEMQYLFPSYKLPRVLYTLRQSLLDKLDKLTEIPVLSIVQAYHKLPQYFPNDLFDEITEMVIVTLQHNPENLKTQFLLDFTDLATSALRRKLSDNKLEIITKQLIQRLKAEPETQAVQMAEKISKIYVRLPRDQELIKLIGDVVLASVKKNNLIPVSSVDLISSSAEVFEPLAYELKRDEVYQKLSNNQKIRIFLALAKYQEISGELFDKLKADIEDLANNNPNILIQLQDNIQQSNKQLRELNSIAAKVLRTKITPETLPKFFRSIFLSIEDSETKQEWQSFIDQQTFNPRLLNKFIDEFSLSLKSSYNQDNIIFFLNVIGKNIEHINSKKLFSVIFEQPKIISEIAKNEYILRRLVQLITSLKFNEFNLSEILQLIMRLEYFGVRSNQSKFLLKRCFEIQTKDGNLPNNSTYITYMIKYKCLDHEDVVKIVENLKTFDFFYRVKVFGIAQQLEGGLEKYAGQVQPLLNECLERLKSDQLSKQLVAIPALLNLHPSCWKGQEEIIVKILQDNSNKINEKSFENILTSIQPKWYKSSDYKKQLQPIVKELLAQYESKNFQFYDHIWIMEHFNSLGVRSIQIFNQFLNQCAYYFDKLTPEQRVRSLNVFANAGICQQDFFIKNLEKIKDHVKTYQNYISEISQAIFKVGLDDPQTNQLYIEYIRKVQSYTNFDKIQTLQTLCMIKAPNDLIEQIITNLNQKVSPNFSGKTASSLINYCQHVGIKPELVEKLKQIFDSKKLAEADGYFLSQQFRQKSAAELNSYLNAMQIEAQTGQIVNGTYCDVYIPSQKILILIAFSDQHNFNQNTFNGQIVLQKKLLEFIPEHKVIILSTKAFFNQAGPNPIDKVNYLLSLGIIQSKIYIHQGIVSKNTSGVYDFTQIKVRPSKQQKGEEDSLEVEQEQKN